MCIHCVVCVCELVVIVQPIWYLVHFLYVCTARIDSKIDNSIKSLLPQVVFIGFLFVIFVFIPYVCAMAASSSSSSSGAFLDLNVPYTRGSTSRHAISALLTTAADCTFSLNLI